MEIEMTRMLEGNSSIPCQYEDTGYSITQLNLAFVLPILTSILSLLGSVTIVCILLRRRKYNRLASTYDRIIFGMSTMDILSSVANMLASLPSPADDDKLLNNMRFTGYGNTATCTAQGFFYHLGHMGTTFYYGALSIYYVIVIKLNTSEKVLKTWLEPLLHAVPILFSFSSGIFLAVGNNFNNATSICWIAPYPVTCRGDLTKCTRGRSAFLYRIIFSGIPIIVIFFIILTCMIMLIRAFRKQNQRMERYKFGGRRKSEGNISTTSHSRSTLRSSISRYSISRNGVRRGNSTTMSNLRHTQQKTFRQAMSYISAYFTTFIFAVIFQFTYVASRKVFFVLYLLQQITIPSQGLFNFIIFIRPQIQNIYKNNRDISFAKAFLQAITTRGDIKNNRQRRRSSVGRRSVTGRSSVRCSIMIAASDKTPPKSAATKISVRNEQPPGRMSVHDAALQAKRELMEEMKEELSLDSSSDSDDEYAMAVRRVEEGGNQKMLGEEPSDTCSAAGSIEDTEPSGLEKLDLIDIDSVNYGNDRHRFERSLSYSEKSSTAEEEQVIAVLSTLEMNDDATTPLEDEEFDSSEIVNDPERI